MAANVTAHDALQLAAGPTFTASEPSRSPAVTDRDVLARFRGLQVWQRGRHRAPHKPLLVLLALGRLLQHGKRVLPYREADEALGALLREFSPTRRSVHPEYPFWRLQNDGVWEVRRAGPMRVREGNADPLRRELLRRDAEGSFTTEIAAALQTDRQLARALVHEILDAHFPASTHEEILVAVGPAGLVEDTVAAARRARDPRFRHLVLTAYEHRCAICGFELRFRGTQLGVDAAHIMWHQAGGADMEQNGLALCVLHHKLFDRGALTVSHTHRVVLSESVHGGVGFEEHLLRYHGKRIGRV
jgi:putative restriction endonuclease